MRLFDLVKRALVPARRGWITVSPVFNTRPSRRLMKAVSLALLVTFASGGAMAASPTPPVRYLRRWTLGWDNFNGPLDLVHSQTHKPIAAPTSNLPAPSTATRRKSHYLEWGTEMRADSFLKSLPPLPRSTSPPHTATSGAVALRSIHCGIGRPFERMNSAL